MNKQSFIEFTCFLPWRVENFWNPKNQSVNGDMWWKTCERDNLRVLGEYLLVGEGLIRTTNWNFVLGFECLMKWLAEHSVGTLQANISKLKFRVLAWWSTNISRHTRSTLWREMYYVFSEIIASGEKVNILPSSCLLLRWRPHSEFGLNALWEKAFDRSRTLQIRGHETSSNLGLAQIRPPRRHAHSSL